MEEFLKDVSAERAFWFNNGSVIRNIYELSKEINNNDDKIFKYHCNVNHDDFANWIGGALGDIVLSQKLRGIIDKKAYLRIINNRIKHLEKKHISDQKTKALSEKVRALFKDYSHIWILLVIVVATCIITTLIYFEYHSLDNLKALDEKINYIEARNTCFNNYFNDQMIKTRELVNSTAFDIGSQCAFNYSSNYAMPTSIFENTPETVNIDDITLQDDKAIIILNNSHLSIFANTSSMIPAINHNTKALEVTPISASTLHIGDIISYQLDADIIVHRIIDIGFDSDGFYAITKGDNNNVVDPNKVRFSQIKGEVIALIY